MPKHCAIVLTLTCAWHTLAWAQLAEPSPPAPAALTAQQISAAELLKHIKVLASDEFEGRAPGTPGEARSIAYLEQQFRALGLAPGNPDGGYLQTVPMNSVRSQPELRFDVGGQTSVLAFPCDFVAWATRPGDQLTLAPAELVFVGYGVQAPEYDWDDFKDVDVRGKILVMLINDPPVPDPADPRRLDPATFGGTAMTYYGRWSYKFAMAARRGAAGALIIHEGEAGYPYSVVRSSWGNENFSVRNDGGAPDFPPFSGWLAQGAARQLMASAGLDFDTLKKQASTRTFRPVALGVQASASASNHWRAIDSHNVVARIDGSDPRLKDELVVYSAHWDHFGIDNSLPGQPSARIYRGARDNASGVAAMLELARAYRTLPQAPRRSILFLLTTAEERGLLGAQYYARHPLYPLAQTVLNINVDGLNVWGRTRDVEIAGYGKSSADDIVLSQAARQGRVALPHSRPELGSFYRSDHFEFAKVGVPVVYLTSGRDYIDHPPGYGEAIVRDYLANQYHKVGDVVRPSWDLTGAVEDVQLIFQVGYQAAQDEQTPQWKSGAEFKAVRERQPASVP